MNPARAATGDGGKIDNLRNQQRRGQIHRPRHRAAVGTRLFHWGSTRCGASHCLAFWATRSNAHRHQGEQAEFGKGSIKGLAAPETANNAVALGLS